MYDMSHISEKECTSNVNKVFMFQRHRGLVFKPILKICHLTLERPKTDFDVFHLLV